MVSSNISISSLIIHRVGNFLLGEGIKFSECLIAYKNIEQDLVRLITNSFSENEIYRFTIEDSLPSNLVKDTISNIFNFSDSFYQGSIDLARLLYEKSTHPSIKKGDFYIILLDRFNWNNKIVKAIALLKTEEKSTFLTVKDTTSSFDITSNKGISLKKVDKGCLILDVNASDGYTVLVSNNTKSNDAHYWTNSFLHVERIEDTYFQTEEFSKICKEFILHVAESNTSLTNAECAEILHKAEKYMASNNELSINDFKADLFKNKQLEQNFDDFKKAYEDNTGVKIMNNFEIPSNALKKIHKSMTKTIILDDNVKIVIDKKFPLIEQGFDEIKNKHFYKIYFDDEKIK